VLLRIVPVNEVFVRVDCDDAIARELSDYFSFDVPGARFMQRNGRKHWDGKIRLFKLRDHSIYRGLIPRLKEFADARGYTFTDDSATDVRRTFALDASLQRIPLKHALRDYQRAALDTALTHERGIILSPTASGKSYIIYLLTQILRTERVLIVVPTIGLVSQMAQDFADYGCPEPVYQIQAGVAKRTTSRLTVSTWQSIYQLSPDYFQQFGCVIVDEVHTAKAKSLTGLMEKCTTARYRLGFTGTLDQSECNRLVLEGLFGAVARVATTAALQQQQHLAKLKVNMCILDYPETLRRSLRRSSYVEEIDALVAEAARAEFIAQLVSKLDGNTLVLFQLVQKQGLGLFKRLVELCAATGKTVHYIAGSVDADDRERIRQAVINGGQHVVVASYGTCQAGINIPNLNNLVLAHPSKSMIRVLQSIGRVLRMAKGKAYALLIDIVDDLRVGAYINHVFRHGQERAQFYSSEKFPVSLKPIDMTKFTQIARPAPLAGAETTSVFDHE
jgi:superfamily II DNA or RNA helicase